MSLPCWHKNESSFEERLFVEKPNDHPYRSRDALVRPVLPGRARLAPAQPEGTRGGEADTARAALQREPDQPARQPDGARAGAAARARAAAARRGVRAPGRRAGPR